MKSNYYKIYIVIIISILISISYLFIKVSNTKNLLATNIKDKYIKDAQNIAINFDSYLKVKVESNLFDTLNKDVALREELNDVLSLFLSNNFKYVYILYKDQEKNKYRYLLDGSISDKGKFKQSLRINKKRWNNVYENKKYDIILQDYLVSIYGTFLYPIVYDNKTEAILAIDFSSKLPNSVSNIIKPLTYIFIYIIVAISLFILLLIWQTTLYIKTKKKSITDDLTGLFNRTYLSEISKNINLENYSVAMIDLDKFKNINDRYGHKTGDYVLKQSAFLFKQSIRDNDILVRFGGEEFLLLIYNRDNKKASIDVCERIRQKIEEYNFTNDDHIINITVSCGINIAPSVQYDIEYAIKLADDNLYESKNTGRNKITAS